MVVHHLNWSARLESVKDIRHKLNTLQRDWNVENEMVTTGTVRKTNMKISNPPTFNQARFITEGTKFNLNDCKTKKIGLLKQKTTEEEKQTSRKKTKEAESVWNEKIMHVGCSIGNMRNKKFFVSKHMKTILNEKLSFQRVWFCETCTFSISKHTTSSIF